jgi:hypothetical protein
MPGDRPSLSPAANGLTLLYHLSVYTLMAIRPGIEALPVPTFTVANTTFSMIDHPVRLLTTS